VELRIGGLLHRDDSGSRKKQADYVFWWADGKTEADFEHNRIDVENWV